MKTIEFIRKSTPTNPEFGYGDIVNVYDKTEKIYSCSGSTCPNPFRPKDKIPWQKAYAFVKCGMYSGNVMYHRKYKKCVLLMNGDKIPTEFPNPAQMNRYYAYEIFIHTGGSKNNPLWRGSAGCLTIDPKIANEFWDNFDIGENVYVAIIKENGKDEKKV